MSLSPIGFDSSIEVVDLMHMISDEAALIQQFPLMRDLLLAYATRQDTSPSGTWLDRFEEWPEVEPEALSRFHGKLIALGLLDFEVSPKGNGVRYQVSSTGRMALMRVQPEDDPERESGPEEAGIEATIPEVVTAN